MLFRSAAPVVVKEVKVLVMSTAPAPDSDWVPMTVASPVEEVTVTAPVVELTEIVWKPFCDRTGPVNVVFAMSVPYMQVWGASVCMSSAGTVRYTGDPGMSHLYHGSKGSSSVASQILGRRLFSSRGITRKFHQTCRPHTVLPCKGTMWSTSCTTPVLSEMSRRNL